MKKLFVIPVLLLLVLLVACGKTTSTSEAPTLTSEEKAIANNNEVIITATNWKFDQPTYTIKKGQPTKLTLVTAAGVHGVVVDELHITINPNKSTLVKIDQPGTYVLRCSVICGAGHAKMQAKLVVE